MKTLLSTFLLTLSLIPFAQTPGQVADSVVCQQDKNHSYALYLPSYYNEDEKWPIIYFFEPAARGSLPVKLYAEVAEELGFILACTNNSRNGRFNDSFKAADALFLDTENRFSIDNSKVILSGFSGGSRLSLSIAVISNAVYGVIGVGAAQPAVPAYMVLNKKNFKYAGLVGARDMNYLEHKAFRLHLNNLGMENILIVSNRRHQWASPEDFRIALLWMQVNSKTYDPSLLQAALNEKMNSDRDSIPISDVILLDRMIDGQDIVDAKDKEIKKKLKQESKIVKREHYLKKSLSDSVDAVFDLNRTDTGPSSWLQKQAEKLKNQSDKSDEVHEKMMYARLLNFLGAACYETSMLMKSQGFTNKALIGVSIWETVYGSPIYGHWLKAKVYAVDNDQPMAIRHLEEALKGGQIKKASIYQEADFNMLFDQPEFQELINKYYN